MSQGQDWSGPAATPSGQPPQYGQADQQPQYGQPYQPPQYGQAYQPPQYGQAYQPPQGQPGYPVAPYQQPYPQGYAGGPQVVPKNPGIALLISFFIPGVGSLYAGKVNTGVIILVGYIVSWILTIIIIGFVGILGFWIWGMIDAYQAAQTWNRQRGLVS